MVVDSRHSLNSNARSTARSGWSDFIAIINAAGPQVNSTVCGKYGTLVSFGISVPASTFSMRSASL